MALGDLFTLAKLTIEGYSDPDRSQSLGPPFTVQYNPESFSLHHENVFQRPAGQGNTAGERGWSYSQPKRLSVTLVLDGTNVGYMGIERLGSLPTVAGQISAFMGLCYHVQSDSHEPAFLKLSWGAALGGFAPLDGMQQPKFPCRLASVDVHYQSFDRDGSPLHAELAAVFAEHLDATLNAAQTKLTSPDLTHRRVVVDGDTLPLLCREIYGSSVHYLRVAQINRLDDFRNLTAGQELIFPPFERRRRS